MIEIKYIWKILRVEALPSLNNLTNVVKRINYEVIALSDDTGYHSQLAGETTLIDPNPKAFIPYFDLDENTMVNWVKTSIGTQTVYDHENELAQNILNLEKPKLIEMDLPWELKEKDKIVTFKEKKSRRTK